MSEDTQQRVQMRTLNWKEEVLKRLGKDANKPDPSYEFSNGRKFDTPTNGGPYRHD